jgi:hypothetical protein
MLLAPAPALPVLVPPLPALAAPAELAPPSVAPAVAPAVAPELEPPLDDPLPQPAPLSAKAKLNAHDKGTGEAMRRTEAKHFELMRGRLLKKTTPGGMPSAV